MFGVEFLPYQFCRMLSLEKQNLDRKEWERNLFQCNHNIIILFTRSRTRRHGKQKPVHFKNIVSEEILLSCKAVCRLSVVLNKQ